MYHGHLISYAPFVFPVRAADSQNLKEKHEADLKKEIKKLQRLRDQIKTWISSTEVKDKEALLEARKRIETKMEEFKVCEKETKTKTYSKEGLLREDKIDPEEEAKMNTTSWLQEYVEKFQQHVEEKDFEIEKLSSGKGKKTNKHLLDELLAHIKHHKFHINKLEGIIRLVNNDVLEPDAVDAIRDDLDYYLESHQGTYPELLSIAFGWLRISPLTVLLSLSEPEYKDTYDEEVLYEALGLEELDVVQVIVPPKDKKANDETTSTSSKGSNSVINSKKGVPSSVIPLTIGRARTKAEKKLEEEKVATPSKKAATPQPKPVPAPPVRVASNTPSVAGESMAAILKRESEQQEKERLKVGRILDSRHK
jgi:CCR4-NOT transcription complex subunit 3